MNKGHQEMCTLLSPFMQAFCSTIIGTLATHAMLKGAGVGDETATAAAATITWLLRGQCCLIQTVFW